MNASICFTRIISCMCMWWFNNLYFSTLLPSFDSIECGQFFKTRLFKLLHFYNLFLISSLWRRGKRETFTLIELRDNRSGGDKFNWFSLNIHNIQAKCDVLCGLWTFISRAFCDVEIWCRDISFNLKKW